MKENKAFSVADMSSFKSHNGNPWGLVYADALTENKVGAVNIQPITYRLHGLKISANVYLPAGYDVAKSYPALVVAHPNGGVKEQVAGLYSQRMAEAGYICLAFDAAYQGASEGEPRNTDKPAHRIDDIRRAADILLQYPGVDANRVGILGICGGGGYTLAAVQTDKRFKAVATLSMFNTGLVRRNGFLDSQINSVQERLTRSGLLQKAVVADRFLPERFIAYLGPYDNTTAVRAFVKQFRQQGIRTVKPILEGELSYGVEIASFSSREAAEKYLVSGRAPDMKGIKVTNRLGEPSGQVDLVFNAVTSEEEDRIRNLTKLYPAAELKSCY